MKTINRYISAILAVIMVLALMLQIGCANGTPQESSFDSSPAPSPEESSPANGRSYNISYDLDGGIDGGNPTTYDPEEGLTLSMPIKPGYDFAGWTGSGLDSAAKEVNIAKGTTGDLSFTATWTENIVYEDRGEVDKSYFGKDDGLTAKEGEIPVATPYKNGLRGEGIYALKTVYTAITVDGTMDPAYTYGLHFKSDINTNNEYYADRATGFDVYMVRGQDGKIYVYANIVDPDIVVEEYIFKNDGAWRVDSIDMYFEFGNYGLGYDMYSFVPDMTGNLKRDMPADTKITFTKTGYAVEFAFDNNGKPVLHNDELSVQFYLNDANEWNAEKKTYKKLLLKHSSVLNPVSEGYLMPSPQLHDAVKASLASATGKVNVEGLNKDKTGDMIADILSGAATVGIIYDKYATAQSILPAQDLAYLFSTYGVNCSIVSEENIVEGISFDYEILFGKTTREESMALINVLNYIEYGVTVGEDSIVFVGWNEKASAAAYDVLYEIIDHVVAGGKTSDLVGLIYKGTVPEQVGDDIPKLDGFDSVTDVGEDAFHVYKLDATAEEYNSYLALLEKAGYTLYTTNVMNNTLCATYCNEDTVVNVTYGGGDADKPIEEVDRSLRVVVDPLANAPLPSKEKPADADSNVTVTSVTQMYPHNLCIVFQLSNGHFIVFDSGNNGTQKELSDFLRKMAPDGKPVVEAWIFSHFHQDHIGGFIDYMGVSALTRYITVKSVIYNFPQDQVVQTAHKSTTDMNNMRLFYDKRKPAMQEKGTTFYQARTGQKYYFGNAEIEILWTFEDLMPFNVFQDDTNRTDIGFRVTIEGQTFMLTGDSTEEQFRAATKRYGDYLKSDFLQLAHHGNGNGKGSHDLYTIVDAPVIFHSRMHDLESASYPIGPNEKLALQNAELVIRSGNYGTATLKLPFKVGDKIESANDPSDESHTYMD